jgi:2-methylaconitate cis-trans-isomerase PrpF
MSPNRIPATWMRGGGRRGLFLQASDLPSTRRAREALLLRAFGGPDPGGPCLDGLGGGGEPGRVAVVSRSQRPGADVDVLFGRVAADATRIDWSTGCAHLVAAVGPYAVEEGLFPATDGPTRVRIRVVNDDARVDAFVPVMQGRALEQGGFVEDGVRFPGAEIRLEFLEPAADPFPGGTVREPLAVPGFEPIEVTCVSVGAPTVFVRADAIGLSAREAPGELARRRALLERLQGVRAAAIERFGAQVGAARLRLAWVARPLGYRSGAGVDIAPDAIDLLVRGLDARGPSRDGAGADALAVAVAAAVPGTVVAEVARTLPGVPTRIGHAGGTLAVGAEVSVSEDRGGRSRWRVERCVLSRSARRLMSGWVHLPPGS